jgi:Na+/alanine symporter
MNNTWWIWAVAILGSAVGVAGGLLGTYFGVRSAKGPRERGFLIRAAISCWVLVLAFAAGLALIPGWYRYLLVVPYGIVLLMGIGWCNRVQARIRREESEAAT